MNIRSVEFNSDLYFKMTRFRDEVLRKPLGLTLSPDDLAGEDQQIHIAALDPNDEIVGSVVLKPLNADVVKLRQMAVSPLLHRTGMGQLLVRFAEGIAHEKGFSSIEMNARTSAKGFYEKLGYASIGDEFIEVTVRTVKMIKSL